MTSKRWMPAKTARIIVGTALLAVALLTPWVALAVGVGST